uniref:Wound-induced protein 1 n=1 Tax=Oryza punctata TaxID=4537 RepID=A0A0E0KCL8_ORYPU
MVKVRRRGHNGRYGGVINLEVERCALARAPVAPPPGSPIKSTRAPRSNTPAIHLDLFSSSSLSLERQSISASRSLPRLGVKHRRSKGRSEPKRGSRQELANHKQGAAAAAAREASASVSELAELDGARESEEQVAKFLVLRLYEALNSGDARRAQELLAPDLEWWFHGPPAHQHMMRLLTGADHGESRFLFSPRSVDAFGSTVIAEGTDDTRQLYWVHAWTVGPDGVITQLREYFNTDLTVTRLSASAAKTTAISSSNHASSSSAAPAPPPPPSKPKCLWQSRRADRAHKSLPGLVLAI